MISGEVQLSSLQCPKFNGLTWVDGESGRPQPPGACMHAVVQHAQRSDAIVAAATAVHHSPCSKHGLSFNVTALTTPAGFVWLWP